MLGFFPFTRPAERRVLLLPCLAFAFSPQWWLVISRDDGRGLVRIDGGGPRMSRPLVRRLASTARIARCLWERKGAGFLETYGEYGKGCRGRRGVNLRTVTVVTYGIKKGRGREKGTCFLCLENPLLAWAQMRDEDVPGWARTGGATSCPSRISLRLQLAPGSHPLLKRKAALLTGRVHSCNSAIEVKSTAI
jgi:hypothetical protein